MTDFQARASQQGQLFEKQCRLILDGLGFDVDDKPTVLEDIGVEVDATATNRAGQLFLFEFKGSWFGSRPGGRRTDTTKKAVLTGFLLLHGSPIRTPYVVLTSHLPKPGSRGATQIDIALRAGAIHDVICVNDPGDMARLEELVHEEVAS